ncbi:MAG: hypothetical protein LC750_00345 [Actinobacteria bacterium]|nr:hypothetical protein [Actinomycetota bacterium]
MLHRAVHGVADNRKCRRYSAAQWLLPLDGALTTPRSREFIEMAYDTKCYDLAEAFLEDHAHLNTESRRKTLAQEIQNAIDSEIADMERNYEPSDAEIARSGPDLRQQQIEAMRLK